MFKEGWRKWRGVRGEGMLKAASANVLQRNNFSISLLFFFFCLPYLFSPSLSAFSNIRNPGQTEERKKKKSLKTIIIKIKKTPIL